MWCVLRWPFAVVGTMWDRLVVAEEKRMAADLEAWWADRLADKEAGEDVAEPLLSWPALEPPTWPFCQRCGSSFLGEHTCLRDEAPTSPVSPAGANPGEVEQPPIAPSPGTDLIAAIAEVLSNHNAYDYAGEVECASASGGSYARFPDWQSWRNHVSTLIAERNREGRATSAYRVRSRHGRYPRRRVLPAAPQEIATVHPPVTDGPPTQQGTQPRKKVPSEYRKLIRPEWLE